MTQLNTLYLVSGMPAVGKTTFATRLAAKAKACLIDIDTTTEPLVQAAMAKLTGDPDDRDSPEFKETFREPVYATLFDLAEANLPNTDVVLTGPFTKELHNPDWPDQVCERLGSKHRVKCVFLHCPAQVREKRLRSRGNPRDRLKLESWQEHLKYYDTESFPAYPHFPVDSSQPDAFEQAIANGLLKQDGTEK